MSQGTRSQVRQIEMEQQLSTLISMVQAVQEQQAGQQELCRGLKSDLEGLATSQYEQVAHLEDLARRQETRVEELIQSQNMRCAEIEQRQLEAQATVENLQKDITTVKEVLNSRIGATESGLQGLECIQQRLTAELHATKTAIVAEMMPELEARFTTKDQLENALSSHRVRSSAPEFVPSLCPSTGPFREAASSVAGGAQLQKPPPFDGRSPWDAYKLQFEMLATVNGWTSAQKATYLAVCLRGPALTVLTNISADHRGDYSVLIAALDRRFGSAHRAELNRVKLKGRVRKREETLPELAEEVEHLARLAYPDATAEMVEVLARDQFIDALPDEEFRLRLRQNKPATLQEALEQALELESIYQANRQRSKVVREIQLESTPAAQVNNIRLEEGVLETLQRLLDAIQQCTSRPMGNQRPGNQRGRGSRATGRKPLVCWTCKKEGHIQRFCTAQVPVENEGQSFQPSEANQDGASPQIQSGNGQ